MPLPSSGVEPVSWSILQTHTLYQLNRYPGASYLFSEFPAVSSSFPDRSPCL